MPKLAREMKAVEVAKITAPGRHPVGGVPGLYFQVQAPDPDKGSNRTARNWILRVIVGAKRRDIGLGGYPAVTLAQAHQRAREARELIEKGIDPVAQRRAARSALKAAQAAAITFEQAALGYIKDHESGWRNAKHGSQWRTTLETYAFPKIGGIQVRDIEVSHVLAVIKPIWHEKTETASRLRGRIEAVLDWAKTHGYRQGDNPARWKGHLANLLPARSKVQATTHHPALPVAEVGALVERLRSVEGIGARALEFVILTAARSGEVRGMRWSEVDLEKKVWTCPAERMKAGRDQRVPLSDAALKVLKAQRPRGTVAGDKFVFESPRGGTLSDMTLNAVLRRLEVEAVPHGFRSTFRDWAAEHTNYPREVAEMALAHTIESKVEAAYRRGDLFEKRRLMMEEWANFCSTVQRPAKVIPMKSKKRA